MRRVIVLGSVKGAPGVTTSALALAAAWPADADGGVRPVVVEADAAGGDVAVRFGRPYSPGLLDLAASARRAHPGSVLGAAQELPFGVRAVAAPASAEQCGEAVRLLAQAGEPVLRGREDDSGTVLLDVGRLVETASPFVECADDVVMVCRGGADALSHVFARCEAWGHSAAQLALVVVGSCPYPAVEITATLGVGRVAFLPWDAAAAAALSGRGTARLRTSGWRSSPLMSTASDFARKLTDPQGVAGGLSGDLAQIAATHGSGGTAPRNAVGPSLGSGGDLR